MTDRSEPSGADDGLTRIVGVVTELGFAGVDRHSDPHRFARRPQLSSERLLRGAGRGERVRRSCERRDDRVALALFLGADAAMGVDHLSEDLVVTHDR